MHKEVQAALKDLKSGLKKIYGENLKHLFLYGSHARKEAEPGSDVDILMILGDFNNIWEEIQRTGELVSEICLKYGIVISLIPMKEVKYNTFKTPLILNVKRGRNSSVSEKEIAALLAKARESIKGILKCFRNVSEKPSSYIT